MLSEAVNQKSLTARFNLGMAYYNGDGVPKDELKASQWLEVAVRQNFSEAQYTLGTMLVEGNGIKRNTNRGLSLLEAASSQGHKLASNYLRKRNGSDHQVKPTASKIISSDNLSALDDEKSSSTGAEILYWCRISTKL